MNKIDSLIAYLFAIQAFSKDIHYSVSGDAFYSKHLLADEVYNGIGKQIDDLIELAIMPYYAVRISFYWENAKSLIPQLTDNDGENFYSLLGLLEDAIKLINGIQNPSKGVTSLFDNIAQDLQKKHSLITRQVG